LESLSRGTGDEEDINLTLDLYLLVQSHLITEKVKKSTPSASPRWIWKEETISQALKH
jgi:hypothetical protein